MTVGRLHTYHILTTDQHPILVHNCPISSTGFGYSPGGGAQGFDLDEIAQLIHGHADVADPDRPSFGEIRETLDQGIGRRLGGQNSFLLKYKNIRVIVNEDVPFRSTTYYHRR